ncbi:MAG TPA: abortive infection family protein [Ruminococcus sp.]|nr:abortive infection family protein [Ruminococcus sp.]
MMFHERYAYVLEQMCGDIDFSYNNCLLSVMRTFSEPIKEQCDRYNPTWTRETTAFDLALEKFNAKTKNDFHIGIRHNFFESDKQDNDSLSVQPIYYIFSIIELQFSELSKNEADEYTKVINATFSKNNLPWLLINGKIIKVDAQQFECELKAKALEQMKELKDAEPKFQSAFIELTTAVEALENGDYQSAINNAGKSYESVLKVILGVDKGSANELTQKYKDTLLRVPATMPVGGFESQVMKSLPFIRNNSGADHGAGAKEVVISKPMAKLAVNLAAALDTYLIEEYAESNRDT